MTTEKRRVPLDTARPIAEHLVGALTPFCERIELAGSIRRERPEVADVEIVAIPRIRAGQTDLFGAVTSEVDELDALVTDWHQNGIVRDRLDKNGRPAFGAKFKRLVYRCALGEMPLDLFSTTRDQWGVIFAIRTGCSTFSHRLVTPTYQGGCMPMGLRVRDGSLWDGGREIPTPEEASFFEAIGVELLDPRARTDHAVPRRLARSGR